MTTVARLTGVLLALALVASPIRAAQGQMGGPMDTMHQGRHGMMMHSPWKQPADAPASLSQFGCLSCHDTQQRGVGPAFAWVAWRYRDSGDAESTVAAFIEHGGQGTWGGVMPDMNVPASDARTIAHWIILVICG